MKAAGIYWSMRWMLGTLMLATAACAAGPQQPVSDRAIEIAEQAIIVDTHIDAPIRLYFRWQDVTLATGSGDFDLPRAQAGRLNVPFMSIYVPSTYEQSGGGAQLAHQLIDSVEAMAARTPDWELATGVAELRRHFAADKMSLAMGMENGTPLDGDLEQLQRFYDRGVRYITLAHNKSNHISDSSYSEERPWQGLSPFGKSLVAAMNDIGMMIDISHVSDQAFYQVIELSTAPVIASHSSARYFTPGFERNMSDDMIVSLAKNGGVIQINFGTRFLTSAGVGWRERYDAAWASHQEAAGGELQREDRRKFREDYIAEDPYPFARLDDVLDHIDHVVALVGIDHVGIGSDYDGVGDTLPVGLKDASTYPALVHGLLDRGYSDEDIYKVLGENLLRVWSAVEQRAGRAAASDQ